MTIQTIISENIWIVPTGLMVIGYAGLRGVEAIIKIVYKRFKKESVKQEAPAQVEIKPEVIQEPKQEQSGIPYQLNSDGYLELK